LGCITKVQFCTEEGFCCFISLAILFNFHFLAVVRLREESKQAKRRADSLADSLDVVRFLPHPLLPQFQQHPTQRKSNRKQPKHKRRRGEMAAKRTLHSCADINRKAAPRQNSFPTHQTPHPTRHTSIATYLPLRIMRNANSLELLLTQQFSH
jgi:hypothetical protein